MATTPEGRVKAGVKRVLKEFGIWYFMPVPYGMGMHGIPDFICCWRGRFLAIETKAPGKRRNITANQRLRLLEIIKAGGDALVVDDPEQLRRFLLKTGDRYADSEQESARPACQAVRAGSQGKGDPTSSS